jgi:hypothetical protein
VGLLGGGAVGGIRGGVLTGFGKDLADGMGAGASAGATRSRLGMDGGLANAGGLPVRMLLCEDDARDSDEHTPGAPSPTALSLGIPPANNAPNCGGPPPPPPAPPPTLPPPERPPPPPGSTMGALRSFVSAFFSLFPAWIAARRSDEAIALSMGYFGRYALQSHL